jgi:hypothetical protein
LKAKLLRSVSKTSDSGKLNGIVILDFGGQYARAPRSEDQVCPR